MENIRVRSLRDCARDDFVYRQRADVQLYRQSADYRHAFNSEKLHLEQARYFTLGDVRDW